MEAIDPRWRKSSFSGNGGDCVEVGTHAAASRVLVRDTRDRTGPVLTLTSSAWRKFTNRVKRSLEVHPQASSPLGWQTPLGAHPVRVLRHTGRGSLGRFRHARRLGTLLLPGKP